MTINEQYQEPTDSAVSTAGLVCLVRTLANGDITEEWLIPLLAISEAMFSALNGAEVVSSRVVWGEVSSGTTGISGSGLSVEWSTIRNPYDDLGIID